MTPDAAFIEAIIAEPDRDDLRLVMADWWEEHGQPERAEFCRVQVELAKPPWPCGGYYCDESVGHIDCDDPTGEKRQALRDRERELLGLHGPDWGSALATGPRFCGWSDPTRTPPHGGPLFLLFGDARHEARVELEFRRGFVEEITCATADWLAHGPALVRASPITTVTLSDRTPQVYHNNGGPVLHGWYRGRRPAPARPCDLEDELWRIVRTEPDVATHGPWLDFDIGARAEAALSAACILWARSAEPAVAAR